MVTTIRRVEVGIRSRRGVSLIEMVVVISMLTIVIGLVGMTFHLLLRSERLVSQSFITERTISRLAIQFRDDVHQSDTGVLSSGSESEKPVLTLGNESGIQIRYLVIAEGLVRLLVANDRVTARDDFRLPDCRLSLFSGSDGESSLQRLVIERPGAALVKTHQESAPLRAMKIDAHLNQKNRFSSATANDETEPSREQSSLENLQ
jgi:prepilin-type N-terminal cleavage/methylation domain-containing protein